MEFAFSSGIRKALAFGLNLVCSKLKCMILTKLTNFSGSIHFSLIAGRILLKDVRYHSSNQTMKIVKAQIQWRYWIRRPTSEEELNAAREGEGKFTPCFSNIT